MLSSHGARLSSGCNVLSILAFGLATREFLSEVTCG